MQDLEPFYNWREFYISADDELSPFFGTEYNEFEYSMTIYNYYIHPQWDDFGSSTMYMKTLYVDYEIGYAIIEFIGEWNDAINNDIMILKRDILEDMMGNGIDKFILIGENILNFHTSDDCYYQEWFDEVEDGWIAAINFREHVLQDFVSANLDYYIVFGGELNEMNWRTFSPNGLFEKVEGVISHRLA